MLSLILLRLHVLANRREDRLVFDLQTAVAESFGYHPQVQAPSHPDAGMAAGRPGWSLSILTGVMTATALHQHYFGTPP